MTAGKPCALTVTHWTRLRSYCAIPLKPSSRARLSIQSMSRKGNCWDNSVTLKVSFCHFQKITVTRSAGLVNLLRLDIGPRVETIECRKQILVSNRYPLVLMVHLFGDLLRPSQRR